MSGQLAKKEGEGPAPGSPGRTMKGGLGADAQDGDNWDTSCSSFAERCLLFKSGVSIEHCHLLSCSNQVGHVALFFNPSIW